ncbi:type III restriction endonuclease subunit R [Luteimonas mephitis]|uniref:type III restriction endonuclease subunit R n=1 Tax=Luteimonas mephitis TaxID=83615 RepID=UPI003A8C974D
MHREQTRFRLMESADRLRHSDMVVVEHPFSRRKFEAGKIYFLNTQKLGRKSLLVRGFEGDDGLFESARPDAQAFTLWDTIRNTVEDPDLTLYLVLDEAHRGMGNASVERSTIVQRLINGERGIPGIPVVWGISATVERFNTAMQVAKGRTRLPDVKVDSKRVQDSGLLKDTIALDIPDEDGRLDTVLVRRAAEKLKESTQGWAEYAVHQGSGETVVPLMVFQVPNKPNRGDIGKALDIIFQTWPELPPDSVANVFGEHATEQFDSHSVPYISPEQVQDQTWVRVLLAKDAISTGWDCPRAEVMVSLRAAQDATHITQLLGRMVRTPLARRIPGNDRLNAVDCLLPFFDEATVREVVKALTDGGDGVPPMGRVLVNPRQMMPNPGVTEAVWQKFTSLPSQTRPQRGAKAPIRLTALAQELVDDGLLPGAGRKAHARMHEVLDAFVAARQADFEKKRAAVRTVQGRTLIANVETGEMRDESFSEEADTAVVNDGYRRTARILSPDITRTYTEVRAARKDEAEDDFEEALIEAREDVAAIGLLNNLEQEFDSAAKKLSDDWLAEYGGQIKQLPHDRQEAYRQITALSREPQDVDLVRPELWIEATAVREAGGEPKPLPTYESHLLCDEHGLYPQDFKSDWEKTVLRTEAQRDGFRFWYRNPGRPSQDSLGIAYRLDGDTQIMRPDFVFFAEVDGGIVADIVDPHGLQYADALAKLQGLAIYAAEHADTYRRIESVAEVKGKLRVLDLTSDAVRRAVADAEDTSSLFGGTLARDYE